MLGGAHKLLSRAMELKPAKTPFDFFIVGLSIIITVVLIVRKTDHGQPRTRCRNDAITKVHIIFFMLVIMNRR